MPTRALASGWKVARIYGITIRLHLSWIVILGLLILTLGGEVLPSSSMVGGGPWWDAGPQWQEIASYRATHPYVNYSFGEICDKLEISHWPRWQYWFLGTLGSLIFIICVLAHELAHSIVARKAGIAVEGITLFVFGGVSLMKDEVRSAAAEFRIAIVGPLMSLILGLACFAGYILPGAILPPQAKALLFWLGFLNIGLVVFNLLPGFPLDGGRVLRAILWGILGSYRQATVIAVGGGKLLAGFLIGVGLMNGLLPGTLPPYLAGLAPIWSVLIGIFLWMAARGSYQQMVLRQAFEGLTVRDVIQRQAVAVGPDLTLTDLVDRYFYPYRFHSFPVVEAAGLQNTVISSERSESRNLAVDDAAAPISQRAPSAALGVTTEKEPPGTSAGPADRLLGVISLRDVQTIPRADWPVRLVRDVMQPLGEADAVRPDEELASVFRKMAEADRGHLPVVEDSRLVGLVTRRDVLNLLQVRAGPGDRSPRG
jgi:Zn-dependent protease